MRLPLVVGKNAILVVCNRLSKIAYFVVTIEETSCYKLKSLVLNKWMNLVLG